ncbi:MAG: LD-carboxypeptidase [Caulobacterales bacterium]|nr:LD-carboxypeptidase [Caulobacterales bacterium]
MSAKPFRIGVVAPAGRFSPEAGERVLKLAAMRPGRPVEIVIHPQCFLKDGHFAGPDRLREDALVETANDPAINAVWFARGGYGSNRIAEAAIGRLSPEGLNKPFLGYSDLGFVLAGLVRAEAGRAAHGPMCQDVLREGGEAAVMRALDWLVQADPTACEPTALAAPSLAFNLTVLSSLLGTPLEPDFSGRVLMIEDVSEHLYRIDRSLFHVTSSPAVRRAAGFRLGRISDVPDNDPPFERTAEEIVRHWCEVSGIAFLGDADIGHDVANKVVPF